MKITRYQYLVAFRAESMETRQRMIEWLREREAVHVLADVWLLNYEDRMAGDITYGLTRNEPFDGRLLVLGLNQRPTDWAHNDLPVEADAWLRENLQP